MKLAVGLVALGLVSVSGTLAQPVPPNRIRGTIEAFDGGTLTLKAANGRLQLTVTEKTGLNGLEAKSVADLRDNVFIGTTAIKDANGRWQATEVHIFPEAMRGAGEGHYAWDLPESTMTNAAITGTAATANGRTMRLKYATGDVEVDVTPKTAIVALTMGDRSLLVPGATVFVLAVPQDGGGLNAVAIVAETRGVKPPM
jgi:hypothetical protein